MSNLRTFFCLLALLLLSSCYRAPTPEDFGISLEDDKQAPVDVRVVQVFRDEKDNLNLKVHVQARTAVQTDNVAITFLGLKDGQVIERKTTVLKDVFPQDEMKKDQLASLSFLVPAGNITEYQVECNWDLEQKKAIPAAPAERVALEKGAESTAPAATAGPVEPSKLSITINEIERKKTDCQADALCEEKLFALIKLANKGSESLPGPELAVSLAFVPEGMEHTSLLDGEEAIEGEDLVSLSKLLIEPGESKTVRVAIERSVPLIPGGRFEPQIRILP